MVRGRPSAALPKHAQISETLIRDIASGRLADGARLPPEREMAEQLGIAVGTLRKALETLSNKGLLDRVQGSGNYVRAREGVASIYSMLRLELKTGGGLPTAEFLGVERLPKPADAPDFGPSDEGWRFRRLRFLGGVPAAMEEIWLDGAQAEQITAEDVSESLYLFYRERLGLVILAAEDRVSVGPVPDWRDPRFPPETGSISGYIERTARNSAGAVVEFSRTWFDPGTVIYINRIGKA
ncbi:GntR family transcriptional regulator [Mameliella sediminis]|uniref:GntR family transcriptional regulator n=1 Tax=Mameliella sediminis TaxID=2836866 RepID=UPI001C486327|nr:GntR family transcriptional regulator [Mameliella sediminis]MBV7395651.1 GntR family transcriptional regulator [Mameliella sediminis]MBY6160063.1 GntR family transcriptional regulator [Mameliella alba]MBY6168533.1 GntR family transcriptional regulator [Mameliella alba]MBY6174246.1 GntR family transcriptional regulator [Mameliella alba]